MHRNTTQRHATPRAHAPAGCGNVTAWCADARRPPREAVGDYVSHDAADHVTSKAMGGKGRGGGGGGAGGGAGGSAGAGGFDAVLCDPPCSGSGTLTAETRSWQHLVSAALPPQRPTLPAATTGSRAA